MHILLFGGSFNPPHLGHLIVLTQAFELLPEIDEIWLLPAFAHTFGKQLLDGQQRLELCRLLVDHIPKTKVCPIEMDYHTSGETLDTLHLLQSETDYLKKVMDLKIENCHLEFSFLMGSDQLPTFTKWGHYSQLLEEMHFYIYPRAGHRHEIMFPHMTLLDSPTQVITNISSTLIRDRLKAHLDIFHLVPAPVLTYITDHHLYEWPLKP